MNAGLKTHKLRILKPSFLSAFFVPILFFCAVSGSYANAREIINFGPQETRIDGSIPYSVVGQYQAQFREFHGVISLDQDTDLIRSVFLEIKVASIASNCQWCDKVVKSRRLLDTAVYPNIIFNSEKIIHDESGYKVKGTLQMRGIKREMIFPFHVQIMMDQRIGKRLLDIKGHWEINRKLFDIIWSRLLDRGGILVGDNITVNWGIKAYLKS